MGLRGYRFWSASWQGVASWCVWLCTLWGRLFAGIWWNSLLTPVCTNRLVMGIAGAGAVPGSRRGQLPTGLACVLWALPPPRIPPWDPASVLMQSRDIRQGRTPGTASLGLHTHSAKLTLPLILSLCWRLTCCQLRQHICIMQDHIWGESDSLPGTKKEPVRILKWYWNLLAPSSSFLGVPTKRALGLRSRNWISRPTSILYRVCFSLQGRVSLTFIKYLPPTKHFARHGMCLFLSNLLSIMGICHLRFVRDEIESENGETVSQERIQNACLCFRGLPRPTSLTLSFIHLFLSLATLITYRM